MKKVSLLRGVAAGGPLVANYGEYNFDAADKEKEGADFGGALDQFFKKMEEIEPVATVTVDSPPPTVTGQPLFFKFATCFMLIALEISGM